MTRITSLRRQVKPCSVSTVVAMVTRVSIIMPSSSHLISRCSEVLEYCKVLELDPVTEKDLLYIAREGIKAPLPKNWKPVYVTIV